MPYEDITTQDLPGDEVPRILMIDDDPDDAELVKEMLRGALGPRLVFRWCGSEASALETLGTDRYDVALVDYRLGTISGVDLIRTLTARLPAMAAILFTGRAGRDVDVAAMEAGAMGYLTKESVDADVLERAIRYAVERVRERVGMARIVRRDPLTGLYNRIGLADRLRRARELIARGEAGLLGVAVLDLDGFKAINDRLGHAHGDQVLINVADALRGAVRPYDTVARTGGDEFVVLLEDLADPVEARSVAARLVSAVASVDAHPEGPVTVSVGVSLFPGCGDTDEQLLAAADAAMYEAKLRGKNQAYVVGQPVAGRIRAPTTAQELHEAIDAGTLDLEYQPQVDLESQELRGLEALVRWRSPDGGPFDASVFVANLERAEAIAELDLWVLEIAREKLCLHPDLQVAVNLSPQTLLHEELAQRLESRPVSNRCIEIELTERFVPLDSKMLTERLHLLQNLGFRVALDDFGVGGSSLARFSKSPVDTLKIDQSFVAGIDADPRNRSIVSSLVFLAELEGLHVVAEGVETEAEYRTLRDLGVRQGQGFYFGHPMPLDAFQAWAKSA